MKQQNLLLGFAVLLTLFLCSCQLKTENQNGEGDFLVEENSGTQNEEEKIMPD